MKKAISGLVWTLHLVCWVRCFAIYRAISIVTLTHGRFTEVALDRDVDGDLFLQDIGQGFGFRPGSFDGAIRFAFPLLCCLPIAY